MISPLRGRVDSILSRTRVRHQALAARQRRGDAPERVGAGG